MKRWLKLQNRARRRAERHTSLAAIVTLLALAVMGGVVLHAQTRYLRGQNIAPVFEGWKRNADGSIVFLFGYLNRNYDEVIDIPVGPDNNIEPWGDVGQPTHFLTRRQRFVFQVPVPKDWDVKKRAVWTLTANGKTEKANGWLQPEWEVDDGVIQMNIGPGGAPPADPPNTGPTVTGSSAQTVRLPATLRLTATATDDGVPKPPAPKAGASPARGPAPGVSLRWIHYRGAGQVLFSQPTAAAIHGRPAELSTDVTFSQPGTYVLKAVASDGLLEAAHDVTVTVTGTPK